MQTGRTDPIIDEVRAIRRAYAARFDYDVEAIFKDIRAREEAAERNYVSRRLRGADPEPGGEHQASRDVPSPQTTPRGDEPRVSKTTKDEEATFGHYMIGVFDALGQSRKLQAQTEVPLGNDEVERERLITNLKDTAGVVIGFRKLFRKFFEGATQSTGLADYLPEPHRTEMLAATASEVLLWGVSDAIFVAVPLARTRHPAARVGDVRRLLLAAGSTWLFGLSTGHPIRGGMEIGTGIDVERGEIYGQALEAAYHLESKVAELPRMVVGPECVAFLEAVKRNEAASDTSSKLAALIAGRCLSMLRRDPDGHVVVDGLGQTMRNEFGEVPNLHDQVLRAHENVRAYCRDFHDAGNTKLAARYEVLRGYFDERLPQWQDTPKRKG